MLRVLDRRKGFVALIFVLGTAYVLNITIYAYFEGYTHTLQIQRDIQIRDLVRQVVFVCKSKAKEQIVTGSTVPVSFVYATPGLRVSCRADIPLRVSYSDIALPKALEAKFSYEKDSYFVVNVYTDIYQTRSGTSTVRTESIFVIPDVGTFVTEEYTRIVE